MNKQYFQSCIVAVLVLFILAPTAIATTIIKAELIESQYGSILASKGYGGALYEYTYDDGTIALKYIEGQNFPLFKVTAGATRTIQVSTSIQSTVWNCDRILATGSDGSTGSSYSCGSVMIGHWYPSFEAFSNSMAESAKSRYGYVSGRDTVILNGVVYNSPTLSGTADPKPTPTTSPIPTPSPTPTPGPGIPTTTTPALANLIAAILAWLKTLGA